MYGTFRPDLFKFIFLENNPYSFFGTNKNYGETTLAIINWFKAY